MIRGDDPTRTRPAGVGDGDSSAPSTDERAPREPAARPGPVRRGSDEAFDVTQRHDGEGSGPPASTTSAARLTHIDRFRVVKHLGAGGMGTVYEAHDPELDRRVAIKLVHADRASAETRNRLAREARAMARVQHPNVVAVHEVGTIGDDIFVVMELVRGTTAAQWLEAAPRARREILALYRQAGAGLAASHRAGLVHRDFKPENILVDDDGRARVSDFGLAAAANERVAGAADTPLAAGSLTSRLTTTGAVMGTPLFMSPEQHEGRPTDARSDQFGFCVALYLALYRDRPFEGDSLRALSASVRAGVVRDPPPGADVPAWLRAVLLRGLAAEPARRFASMDELLTALDRIPARRRRWTIGAAVVAALTAGAAITWIVMPREQAAVADPCAAASAPASQVWNGATRAAVEASFAASGRPYAADAARRASTGIEHYLAAWSKQTIASCRATHVERTQSPALLDARTACLARRLDALTRLVARWRGPVDGTDVDEAVLAVRDLPHLEACADRDALAAEVPMPADADARAAIARLQRELATFQELVTTAPPADALARADQLLTRAEALRYPPLVIDGLEVVARAAQIEGRGDRLEAALRRMIQEAATIRDAEREATAWTELIRVTGAEQGRFDEALALRPAAEAAGARLGSPGVARATLLAQTGRLLSAKGEIAQGIALLREAAELARPTDVLLAARLDATLAEELGIVHQLDEADRRAESAHAILERELGPGHPRVAMALSHRATIDHFAGRPELAVSRMERALATLEAAYGPHAFDVAVLRGNLANILLEAGRPQEALDAARAAIAGFERTVPEPALEIANTSVTLGGALRDLGRIEEARDVQAAALARAIAAVGERHLAVGVAASRLADTRLALGDLRGAAADLDRAFAALDSEDGDAYELAGALLLRATVEARARRPARARPYAERAVAVAEALGDPDAIAEARAALARLR